MLKQNKAIVQRYIEEVWNEKRVDSLNEIVTSDYVFHNAPPGIPFGSEGLKQFVTMYFSAFPDWVMTAEDLIAEGDKVAMRYTGYGTHKGEFMGISPTNKQVRMRAIAIFRIADGKIAESWNRVDMVGFLRQIGFMSVIRGMASQYIKKKIGLK